MSSALPPFRLERYFAEYEFKVKYLLSASDCEGLKIRELLDLADDDSRQRWSALSLAYTESQGLPALREEVALHYAPLNADDVLIAAPEECIYIAMRTILSPGDHVIAISPAYQSLHEVARSVGCELTKWPVRLDGDRWSLDLDELKRAIQPNTRLLIINFPHNPTGLLPSRETLGAILQIADGHGLYVFSDEMYRWLEYDPQQCLPPVCSIYERGISLSGLSKSLALPGLRIGWLAARDRNLMLKWMTYKDYTTICNSAPSEVLALMALRAKDAIARRNLDIISANLHYADEFFNDYAAMFSWHRPRAGSVAFPRWTGTVAVEDFCRMVLDEHGVMIVPGSLFDVPGGFFRLGLGRTNFTQAMDLVRGYLGRHRR